jgi:hypothetical protein
MSLGIVWGGNRLGSLSPFSAFSRAQHPPGFRVQNGGGEIDVQKVVNGSSRRSRTSGDVKEIKIIGSADVIK